jgi:hypothetical protein
LLSAVEQLTPPELESFVADVLALRSRRAAPCLSTPEDDLLRKINQGFPEEVRQRFAALKGKRQAETLTPQEHSELLTLTARMEQQEAERLRALSDLAQLRKTTLTKLMHDLGIRAPADE